MKHLFILSLFLASLPLSLAQFSFSPSDNAFQIETASEFVSLKNHSKYSASILTSDAILYFTCKRQKGDPTKLVYSLCQGKAHQPCYDSKSGMFPLKGHLTEMDSTEVNILEITDINGDKQRDIIAFNKRKNEIFWLENHDYERFEHPQKLTRLRHPVSQVHRRKYGLYSFEFAKQELHTMARLTGNHEYELFSIHQKIPKGYKIAAIAEMQPGLLYFMLNDDLGRTFFQPVHQRNRRIKSSLRLKPGLNGLYQRIDDIRLADVNNDQQMDVVQFHKGSFYLYKNLGDYKFSLPICILQFETVVNLFKPKNEDHIRSWYFDFSDVNNDGLIDIVCRSEYCMVLENQGDGNFKAKRTGETPYDIDRMMIIDLDNDGDTDFLINAYYGLVYVENQNGTYVEHIPIGGEYLKHIFVIDIDGDGDNDIAFTGYEGDKLLWWAENKSGRFKRERLWTTPAP